MIEKRTKIFEDFKDISIKKACIDKKTKIINNQIQVLNRFGTDSQYGEAYKACFPLSCKYKIALKIIPLSKKEIKLLPEKKNKTELIKNTQNEEALNNSTVFSELFFLKLCNFLVRKNINPHLPLIYRYFICNDCNFLNKNISLESKECVLVANELADGDLKDFITTVKPSLKELLIAYFQIFTGIYTIHKYFNIYHTDLHWGNVLFHKNSKKKQYTRYNIILNGEPITVKNIGYLMVLWDFGLSFIPKKINSSTKKPDNSITWKTDYKRIISMLELDDEQTFIEYHLLGKKMDAILKNSDTPEKFLFDISIYINVEDVKKENIQQVFNMDKNVKTNDKYIKKYLSKEYLNM